VGKKGVGFAADIESKQQKDVGELFARVLPEDLLGFGLIPEFIGRLPVICNVHQLRKEDLVAILCEPKNALTKQYKKFFAYDGVELIFAKDALDAIADHALKLDTGARGLRSIIESALTNVMFELPSRRDVSKCVVTKEVIEKRIDPTLVTSTAREDLELDQESA
jgi:ATP-dependent Clp protease ATP-binding subunit ClpX